MEEKSWELLINITWPHNKFAFGWEYVPSDDEFQFESVLLHVGFVTFILNF